jgi:threonine dehydratase
VLTSRTLDRATGASVLLKMESFQRAGSFKFRGAYSRISLMTPEELRRGVVAYSSGNHAQAVALAASIRRTAAVIVMPEDAPPEKAEATRAYGAEVVTYDRYSQNRAEIGQHLADERGLTLVPPYDDLEVMAGQGTAALELVEDEGPVDVLITPVSGGGLIAGCGMAARSANASTRVIGVEPEDGDDTRRSLAEGRRVRLDEVPRTIADGLAVDTPGELTFPVNREQLESVIAVSDADLVDAMAFLYERCKVVVEPSGAAGVAALLTGRVPHVAGRRVGVIVSGGNVAADRFASLISGRTAPAGLD